MFPKINPTNTAAWKALQEQYSAVNKNKITQLFEEDPNRFENYSTSLEELIFDYSKNNSRRVCGI